MYILSKTCLFFLLFAFFSLKCKILLDGHFLGSKIKTELKEKLVKAPNTGFTMKKHRHKSKHHRCSHLMPLQNGSGRENVQRESKEEKKPRLGEVLLHVLVSWWKPSNDTLIISRSSQLRKWEFPVFITEWLNKSSPATAWAPLSCVPVAPCCCCSHQCCKSPALLCCAHQVNLFVSLTGATWASKFTIL